MSEGLFGALNVYDDIPSRTAAMNMAIDEALLEIAQHPAIRFYRWNHPALSFGYFGRFEDVSEYGGKRDIVRRWTGGGIVFHGEDLTYSVIIPASDKAFAESSGSIYAAIHTALKDALVSSGAPAELAEVESRGGVGERSSCDANDGLAEPVLSLPKEARPSTISDVCFARPVPADVMLKGRKIAGAAQRRTRRGLLQQGSIQQVELSQDFAARFADKLSSDWTTMRLNKSIIDRAAGIAREKYGMTAWVRRR